MASELKVDTISEVTSANGVAVDGVTLKDGNVGATGTATSVAGIPFYSVSSNNSLYTHDVSGTDNTAENNTAYGFSAMDAITTGDHNVAIGKEALTANTTGSSNILLGYDADVDAVDTSNAIVIGIEINGAGNDFTFGKASNVVSNDFDTDANWSRSSDERLKKNITNQTLGLDFINALRTVKYNWKPSDELDANDAQLAHLRTEDKDGNIINQMNTTAVMHGLIAQEVKTALDTAGVSDFGGWKEDQYGVQQISREMYVLPLIKAMQEQTAVIAALTARIETLEGK